MSVITPVNGSGGGGGGGEVSAGSTFVTSDEFYLIKGEALNVSPNFSQTLGTISVPAGKELYIHQINFETTSQEFGRFDSIMIDGTVFNVRMYGNLNINFAEMTGSPLKVRTDIAVYSSTSADSTVAHTHSALFFGRLLTI